MDDTEYKVSFPYTDGKEAVITQTQTIVNVPDTDTDVPVDNEVPSGPTTPEEDTDQPQTGDHTRIWIWYVLGAFSIFGMAATVLRMRKKEPVDDKKRIFKSK